MNNKLTIPCEVGEISDGYHTFNELYEHRCVLFLALMKCNVERSWVSKKHHDESCFEGWFIAGMNLPTGPITYHLPMKYWDTILDKVCCEILNCAPPWDGHTSNQVIERIFKSL